MPKFFVGPSMFGRKPKNKVVPEGGANSWLRMQSPDWEMYEPTLCWHEGEGGYFHIAKQQKLDR